MVMFIATLYNGRMTSYQTLRSVKRIVDSKISLQPIIFLLERCCLGIGFNWNQITKRTLYIQSEVFGRVGFNS